MSDRIQYAVIAADESEIRRQFLASALAPKYNVITASDTDEVINILNLKKHTAVLLLDISAEDRGRAVLRKMRELGISVPVLLASEDIDSGDIKEYVSLGVCDFMEKPCNTGLLSLRVENAAELYMLRRRTSPQKAEEEPGDSIGTLDALTNLPNRAALIARINALIADASPNYEFAFMLVDIDRFKNINDTLGHQTGDYILTEISRELRACTRAGDIVARIGGDEFVVVIPGVGSESLLKRRGEQICLSFSRQIGEDMNISSSIGIAVYPRDGMTFAELYRHADIALYSAKSSGRNQVTFYDQHMCECPYPVIQEPQIPDVCQTAGSSDADMFDEIISALKPCGIEPDVALTRFMGNRSLLVRFVLRLASYDLPDLIKIAVERGDWGAVGETALSIKSAAANLTLPELYDAASELYSAVTAKDYTAAAKISDLLINDFLQFKSALNQSRNAG